MYETIFGRRVKEICEQTALHNIGKPIVILNAKNSFWAFFVRQRCGGYPQLFVGLFLLPILYGLLGCGLFAKLVINALLPLPMLLSAGLVFGMLWFGAALFSERWAFHRSVFAVAENGVVFRHLYGKWRTIKHSEIAGFGDNSRMGVIGKTFLPQLSDFDSQTLLIQHADGTSYKLKWFHAIFADTNRIRCLTMLNEQINELARPQ